MINFLVSNFNLDVVRHDSPQWVYDYLLPFMLVLLILILFFLFIGICVYLYKEIYD